MDASPAAAICIVGTPRSGTSVVAACLHDLGVFLGREDELRVPDVAHPSGSWEPPEIVSLNERLLGALGGNGGLPGDLPPGWERRPEMEEMRAEAHRLLDELFSGTRQWAWKDPRSAVTLPFWQALVDDLRHVICVRNPLDVALSTRALGNGDADLGAHLGDWVTLNALILEHTSGHPRLVIDYEDLLAEPRATIQRLARFAGVEAAGAAEGELLVDPTVPLFRTPPEEALRDPRTDRDAAALYRELRRVRAIQSDSVEPETLAAEWAAVDKLARRLRRRQARRGAGKTGGTPTSTEPERVRGSAELAGLRTKLGKEKQRAARMQAERDAALAQLAEADGRLKEANGRLAEATEAARALEVAAARAGKLEAELERRQARIEELGLAADEQQRRLDHQAAELAETAYEREGAVADLEERLAATEERAKDAESNLVVIAARAGKLEETLESQFRRAVEAEQLADRQRELVAQREQTIRELEGKTAELQQIAARELENVAARDERLVEAHSKTAELFGHIERLKAALEERDSRLEEQRQFIQEHREEARFRDAQHQQLIDAIRSSRSWRVTKPMRAAAVWSRRVTRRAGPDVRP